MRRIYTIYRFNSSKLSKIEKLYTIFHRSNFNNVIFQKEIILQIKIIKQTGKKSKIILLFHNKKFHNFILNENKIRKIVFRIRGKKCRYFFTNLFDGTRNVFHV